MTPVPELNDLVETVGDRCPQGTELDRLRAASEVAREVGRVGEDLVTHYVGEARAAGASWSDIGDVLGVTRQGAHQRHADRPRPERWWRFEGGRFTERARSAVRAAIDEARSADNAFVGTEHLLLGVLDVPGNVGLTVLERLGVTPEQVRTEVTSRLLPPETEPPPGTRGGRGRGRGHRGRGGPGGPGFGMGPGGPGGPGGRGGRPGGPPRRRIPFTPQGRRVFDLSVGEALALGHNYIGCEHMLLAVAVSDGIAADALQALDLGIDRLRQGVIEVTDGIEASKERRPDDQ